MINRYLRLSVISLLPILLIACAEPLSVSNLQQSPTITASPTPTKIEATVNGDLTQLFSRIWSFTNSNAPSKPPLSSIYIFLPNGTLLETSCTETYRIATWTIDKQAPRMLRVMEDGKLAFTATITELTDTTLRLQQILARSNERRELTLTAVEKEFVCPDFRKS
jgi:hypothetical protein